MLHRQHPDLESAAATTQVDVGHEYRRHVAPSVDTEV
jgi:hypothetical protein